MLGALPVAAGDIGCGQEIKREENHSTLKRLGGALRAAGILFAGAPAARAADSITIGFGRALPGGLAPNG
jgi:hypothetical protein